MSDYDQGRTDGVVLDQKKTILAWSLYDWANSAFATTVMAGFFPLFLSDYWGVGVESTTASLALGNAIASLLVAIMAPILGAISDKLSGKKKFLVFFAFMGALSTLGLAFLARGMWQMAILVYIIGTIGFSGANIFYDALLPAVASEKKIDYVSSLGFSLGYIGGGLLFTVNVVMYLFPEWFGLVVTDPEMIAWVIANSETVIDAAEAQIIANQNLAIQVSFITVGLWWLIFSIPILRKVKEPQVEIKVNFKTAVKQGFAQLKDTLGHIKHLKYVLLFLLAYWFYIDGVDTIIRMAVDYGNKLETPLGEKLVNSTDLVIMLLMVQFVAFPGTLIYNWFSAKIGVKRGLMVAIFAYMGITIFGYFISAAWHMYILGGVVGLFQGGIQALSRSLYSRLIPEDKAAEFYGFFNMLGKFAAVIGPILMFIVLKLTDDNNRLAILSILILFIVGAILLWRVDIEKGEQMARDYLGKK